MDKKEARIKCSGCGTPYKLKIPVTEKPVSFKCKKCGKVLKIRIAATAGPNPSTVAPAPPAPLDDMAPTFDDTPVFETTQLPDTDYGRPDSAPEPDFQGQLERIENHTFSQSKEQAPEPQDKGPNRRWLALAGDMVKGPFSDDEIVSMIKDGDVIADTSLRMGERPWIKACEIAAFRKYFPPDQLPLKGPLDKIKLLDDPSGTAHEPQPLFSSVGALLPYPFSGSNAVPLAVFFGIAFLLSSAISLQFWIGLPLNLLGWVLLYGYLGGLMRDSKRSGENPAPTWNFSDAKNMLNEGVGILVVLLVYCMVPTVVFLLLMIISFLNSVTGPGYLFLFLTVVAYAASLFVAPAALVLYETSGKLGTAFNLGNMKEIIKTSGRSYLELSTLSLAVGLAVMLVTILALFLCDIPMAGFLLAGLVMALVLSYGHFVWFHMIGRFSGVNAKLTAGILAKTAA
jgi:predicted RNA-binding Zn-ribbon protein involved in translation (DUF1610 family)